MCHDSCVGCAVLLLSLKSVKMTESTAHRFFRDTCVAIGPLALVGACTGGLVGYLATHIVVAISPSVVVTITPGVFACVASTFVMNGGLIDAIARCFHLKCPRLARFIWDISAVP